MFESFGIFYEFEKENVGGGGGVYSLWFVLVVSDAGVDTWVNFDVTASRKCLR
jgi:hypothetical protein